MATKKKDMPFGVIRRRRCNDLEETHEVDVEAPSPDESPEADNASREAPEEGVAERQAQDPGEQVVDQALLANFTHQIINPLNGVLGTLHNIIDGTVSDDRRPQRLRAVYGQLSVTLELVRNLAFLSQLSTEAGRESMRKLASDVVLPRTIIEAAQFFQEMAESHRMKIFLKNRDDQFVVSGHAPLLRQVFMNLFENGIKYGDPDSEITVEMRDQFRRNRLLVEVVSSGAGFDPDESDKMFELGFRGRHARNVLASGSGLGLYICRQILELHDAEITAECSSKSRTVIFRLAFPHYRLDEPRKPDADE